MKTKTKQLFKIDWRIAFVIMTGMFVALLFYTVTLSLQVRQGIKMTYKKMMMEKMNAQPSQEASPASSMMTKTDGNIKKFNSTLISLDLPKGWEIKPESSTDSSIVEKYDIYNTNGGTGINNGGGVIWKEHIFLSIINKNSLVPKLIGGKFSDTEKEPFPLDTNARMLLLTGFPIDQKDQIMINGKPIQVFSGGAKGTVGWYTFLENNTYAAVFNSTNDDPKDKTVLYPGVGDQKEIISSFKFK